MGGSESAVCAHHAVTTLVTTASSFCLLLPPVLDCKVHNQQIAVGGGKGKRWREKEGEIIQAHLLGTGICLVQACVRAGRG